MVLFDIPLNFPPLLPPHHILVWTKVAACRCENNPSQCPCQTDQWCFTELNTTQFKMTEFTIILNCQQHLLIIVNLFFPYILQQIVQNVVITVCSSQWDSQRPFESFQLKCLTSSHTSVHKHENKPEYTADFLFSYCHRASDYFLKLPFELFHYV